VVEGQLQRQACVHAEAVLDVPLDPLPKRVYFGDGFAGAALVPPILMASKRLSTCRPQQSLPQLCLYARAKDRLDVSKVALCAVELGSSNIVPILGIGFDFVPFPAGISGGSASADFSAASIPTLTR
jgi:hypothetical protein